MSYHAKVISHINENLHDRLSYCWQSLSSFNARSSSYINEATAIHLKGTSILSISEIFLWILYYYVYISIAEAYTLVLTLDSHNPHTPLQLYNMHNKYFPVIISSEPHVRQYVLSRES